MRDYTSCCSEVMSVDYPSPWAGGVASVKGVGPSHPPPSVEPPEVSVRKLPKIEGKSCDRHVIQCCIQKMWTEGANEVSKYGGAKVYVMY